MRRQFLLLSKHLPRVQPVFHRPLWSALLYPLRAMLFASARFSILARRSVLLAPRRAEPRSRGWHQLQLLGLHSGSGAHFVHLSTSVCPVIEREWPRGKLPQNVPEQGPSTSVDQAREIAAEPVFQPRLPTVREASPQFWSARRDRLHAATAGRSLQCRRSAAGCTRFQSGQKDR